MTFHDFEIAYLREQPLGRLATAQANGTLQVSPVGGCAAWRSAAPRRRSAT